MNKYLEKIANISHEAIRDILDTHEDRKFELENVEDSDPFFYEANDVDAAKNLLALKGMGHLVNHRNAGDVIDRMNTAVYSNSLNPPAAKKFLGTLGMAGLGAATGIAMAHTNMHSRGPWPLIGGLAGAAAGGIIGHNHLVKKYGDAIDARNEENRLATDKSLEDAYAYIASRYGHGH